MVKLKHFMILALALAMSLGAWAQQEVLLTTVTATGQTSYSQSPDGIVTVSLNIGFYDDYQYGWLGGTVTVDAAQGYTITRCVFKQNTVSIADDLAPFTATLSGNSTDNVSVETSTGHVNGDADHMIGITSIEVYGYAADPSPTVTHNADGSWGFTMPGYDAALNVTYYLQPDLAWTYNSAAMPAEGLTAYRGFELPVIQNIRLQVSDTFNTAMQGYFRLDQVSAPWTWMSITDNFVAADMDNFVDNSSLTEEQVLTFPNPDPTANQVCLIYGFDGSAVKYVLFNGTNVTATSQVLTKSNIYYIIDAGAKIFYTTSTVVRGLTLRYGSSNPAVVSFSNPNNMSTFSVNGTGEADIYAVFDGDTTFLADSVAFHVTIADPDTLTLAASGQGTVSALLGGDAVWNNETWANLSTTGSEHSFTVGDITLSHTGNEYEGFYQLTTSGNPLRILSSSGTLTFTSNGAPFTRIQLLMVDEYSSGNPKIQPLDGWSFDGRYATWEGNAQSVSMTQCTTKVDQIVFTRGSNSIVVLDEAAGTYAVIPGATVQVVATAQDGNYVSAWSDNRQPQHYTSDTNTITVGESMTLTATFAQNPLLTLASNNGGTVSLDGDSIGTVYTFTFEHSGNSEDDRAITIPANRLPYDTTFSYNANIEFADAYDQMGEGVSMITHGDDHHTVTVRISGPFEYGGYYSCELEGGDRDDWTISCTTGTGPVTPNGITKTGDNTYRVLPGTQLSVTATPDSAHYLARIDGLDTVSNAACGYTFTMPGNDYPLMADFTAKPTLTLYQTDGGTLEAIVPQGGVTAMHLTTDQIPTWSGNTEYAMAADLQPFGFVAVDSAAAAAWTGAPASGYITLVYALAGNQFKTIIFQDGQWYAAITFDFYKADFYTSPDVFYFTTGASKSNVIASTTEPNTYIIDYGTPVTVVATPDAQHYLVSFSDDAPATERNSNLAVEKTYDSVIADINLYATFQAKPTLTLTANDGGTLTVEGAGSAGGEVTIGNGTETTSVTPYNSLWEYSFVESLYTAEEIGTAGTITSVSYHLRENDEPQTSDFVIYMKNVSRSTFASGTDYEPVTDADIVYSGSVTFNPGWTTITLGTPFEYDGTSNLMIAFDENIPGFITRYFYYTDNAGKVVSYHADNYNPDPYNLGSYAGNKTVSSNRANIKLDIAPAATAIVALSDTTYRVDYGTDVTVVATPDSIHYLATLGEELVNSNDSIHRTFTMTAPVNLPADFRAKPTLTLAANDTTWGKVEIPVGLVATDPTPAPTPTAVANPVITGVLMPDGSMQVTMSCTTQDADIYYTTNGVTSPKCDCPAAPEYTNALTFTEPVTIKAAAYTGNDWSAVVTKTITLSLPAGVAKLTDSTYRVDYGTEVTVQAIPDTAHYLVRFVGDAADTNSNDTVKKVYMNISADVTAKAIFAPKPKLTLAQNEEWGTVYPHRLTYPYLGSSENTGPLFLTDEPNVYTVNYGAKVILVADAIDLHHVVSWQNQNGTEMDTAAYFKYFVTDPVNLFPDSSSLTFTITADTTVNTLFGINSYDVTAMAQLDSREEIGTGVAMGTVQATYRDIQGDAQSVAADDTITYTAQGASISTLVATPYYGYLFSQWTDTTGKKVFGTTDTLRLDSANVVVARFVPDTFAVATDLNVERMGTVTGAGRYPYLTQVTLEGVSEYGYHFDRWNDFDINNPRTVQLVQDTAFKAFFDYDQFRVQTSSANDTMGSAIANLGTDFYCNYLYTTTFVATPATGYHFVQWSNGLTTDTARIVIVQDTVMVAFFAPNKYTVTAKSANATMGTTSGSGVYDYGTTATLVATAKTGYSFTGWSDGVTTAERTITIDFTHDTTVTANFTVNQYTVTVESADTVMGSVSGTATVDYNTRTSISATANEHYHFVKWNDGVTSATRTVTVREDVTYTATFAPDMYTITGLADQGQGSVTGSGSYAYLTNATLTATPACGYLFDHWSNLSTESSITVQVTGNETYTAFFRPSAVEVVHDTIELHDTTVVEIHDTTVVAVDTMYIPVPDTTLVPVVINDTTIVPVDIFDTTVVPVTWYDTTHVDVTWYDTTIVDVTINDTTVVPVTWYDTTHVDVTVMDTTIVPVTIVDTTLVPVVVPDTTFVPVTVYDTTVVPVTDYDTTVVPVTWYDTTIVPVTWYDTTVVPVTWYDTTVVPVTWYDTTRVDVTEYDTTHVDVTVVDSTLVPIHDTVIEYVEVHDTLWLVEYIYDTVYIHDTIFVGVDDVEALDAKIYANNGQIVVEGADGNKVVLYDVTGRILATKVDEYAPLRFDIPVSGTYLVKIGNHAARRIVMIR